MFGLLTDVLKGTITVATAPIVIVADVVTMGGVLTDKPSTYTGTHLGGLMDTLKAISKK